MDAAVLKAGSVATVGSGRLSRCIRRYAMYGLSIASEIDLLIRQAASTHQGVPDLVFRYAEPGALPPAADGALVAEQSCEHHGAHSRVYRTAEDARIWVRHAGTFHVVPSARTVTVYPDDDAIERLIEVMLVGQVATFTAHLLGCPSLHASAVVTPNGALAFLGSPGQGKSSMAGVFLKRGASLLTDDALPLRAIDDAVYGMPGPAMMKLWDPSVEHILGLHGDMPQLMPRYEKKLLIVDGQYDVATEPEPLRAVYVLDRYDRQTEGRDDVVIERLAGAEAVGWLLACTSGYAFLQPTDAARMLPLYTRLVKQATVRRLRYPSGFDMQGQVHDAVLADLAALR